MVASLGTVMVVAEAYVHESLTGTQPSQVEALVPMLIEESASLEPAIAAPVLMLSLSMLPFTRSAIVLTGLLTLEALISSPGLTCSGLISAIQLSSLSL